MPHSPVTILNVEEEQTTRQARSLTLRLAGYRVFDAVHTEEAVRLSTQEQPALCILPSEINQQWKLWADRAPVLMWMNGPSGCEFVNAAYLRFLGVTDRDTAGYQWAEFVHPDDRDGYVAGYLRAVEERRLFEATFRFRRFDGEYRWMKSVAIPRFSLHDEFLGYVVQQSMLPISISLIRQLGSSELRTIQHRTIRSVMLLADWSRSGERSSASTA